MPLAMKKTKDKHVGKVIRRGVGMKSWAQDYCCRQSAGVPQNICSVDVWFCRYRGDHIESNKCSNKVGSGVGESLSQLEELYTSLNG